MYLLVDLSWLYVRYFFVEANKIYKDPSIYGVIYFLELLHKNIDKYKQIIFVLDGDSELNEKYKLLKSYKEGRSDKTEVYKNFNDFLKLISVFPNSCIVRNIYKEADETLSYLAMNYSKKGKTLVYSGDKDMLQLFCFNNVQISNTYKEGKFILLTEQDIVNKFKNSKKEVILRKADEILKYRTFRGDSSDKIKSAIKGIQDKVIMQIIDVWYEDYLDQDVLASIILRIEDEALRHKIAANFDNIILNYKIMDLLHPDKDYKLRSETKKLKVNVSKEELNALTDKYGLLRYKHLLSSEGIL